MTGTGAVDRGRLGGAGVLPAYILRLRACPDVREKVDRGLSGAFPTGAGTIG